MQKELERQDLYKWTNNSYQYRKLRKIFLANVIGLCKFCPYHNGENYRRGRKDNKCWKTNRKTQYKIKGV